MILLSFIISINLHSQGGCNTDFYYSEKDYLATMNKVLHSIEDLCNIRGNDSVITSSLIDLSCDSVYVLSPGAGMDQKYVSDYCINEWFVPMINILYTDSSTLLEIVEKDVDKWGVWFRVELTDINGGVSYIDIGINKTNKISSIIL